MVLLNAQVPTLTVSFNHIHVCTLHDTGIAHSLCVHDWISNVESR